jgi:hypothetical protein
MLYIMLNRWCHAWCFVYFWRVVSYCGTNLTVRQLLKDVLDYETYITVTDLILENKIPELLVSFNEILAKDLTVIILYRD